MLRFENCNGYHKSVGMQMRTFGIVVAVFDVRVRVLLLIVLVLKVVVLAGLADSRARVVTNLLLHRIIHHKLPD